jgi:hypothetical protein
MPIAKVVLLVERKALVVQLLVLLVKITISTSTIRTFCKVALILFRPVSPIEHKEIQNFESAFIRFEVIQWFWRLMQPSLSPDVSNSARAHGARNGKRYSTAVA